MKCANDKIVFLKEEIGILKKKLEEAERTLNKKEEEQKEIQEREQIFTKVFENAPIGIAFLSIDGKYLKVNRTICDITGYSRDELLEKNFREITYLDDLNIENDQRLLRNELNSYTMEKRYMHKQGHFVSVVISVSLARDHNGDPLYFISQIQDITNIKRAKETLEYDKLKTEFFANISHELRTPINIILSIIQLLVISKNNDESMCNSEEFNKYLKTMKQNCYRIIRLTNNLIDTTKIDANFYSLNLKNYNIVQIVENITLSTAEYVRNKGRELIFDTDIEEKVITCDADKIERIILNLLSNAIKFTEKNGIIKVLIKSKKDSITISVEDNGIGISQDKLDLVFERFGQVNKSLSRSHEGSGIGLSLVKSFVNMHEGGITVKSKLGRGSKFIIKLPVKIINKELVTEQNEIDISKKEIMNEYIERVNIEFSDIYL